MSAATHIAHDVEFAEPASEQAVVTTEDKGRPNHTPAPLTADNTATIISMIERASRDPAVDIDKLDRLIALHQRAERDWWRRQFNSAMTQAQREMGPIRTDAKNDQTKSRYATYAALDAALRPIYTDHGFGLSFNTGRGTADEPLPEQHVRVICIVSHESGYEREYSIDMPADGKGARGNDVMTRTHAAGSAVSYGMRYLLKMIFNIAIGDDDGNAAGGRGAQGRRTAPQNDHADTGEVLSAQQVSHLQQLIVERGVAPAAFIAWVKTKVPSAKQIEDIPAPMFDLCIRAIDKFYPAETKGKKQ